jgi:primosomal protein N' (replication factor Y)
MPKDVKVRLLDAPSFLDKPYTYSVPEHLDAEVQPGVFVTVPFGGGNRRHVALVTAREDRDPTIGAVKPIHALSTSHAALTKDMLALADFLCEQTLCTMGEAVHAMLPAGVLGGLCARYRTTERPVGDVRRLSTEEAFLYAHLKESGECSEDALRTRFGAGTEEMLAHLLRLKLISRELVQKNAGAAKESVIFSLAATREHVQAILSGAVKGRMGEKQKLALSLLLKGDQTAEQLREAGCTKAQTDALLEKELIARRTERQYRDLAHTAHAAEQRVEHPLSDEQETALAEIGRLAADGEGHAILLHGVTGSGKTYVMLKTIDRMLEKGRGVIVLLPEIALTPQSLSIFCTRYGNRVAVMHSGLSQGERLDAYTRIASGEADVVVGTRSAIFAPVKDLGLIVMDEEHEHTYKSDMNPKYHARDVARFRTAQSKALLLLCSATPSLESYQRAKEGRYTLLTLKKRPAGSVLPEVTVADMRLEPGAGNLSPLGSELTAALTQNLADGNQSILFLNRRGYNHVVSCRSCGKPVTCPACSVSMTYHTKRGTWDEGELICHLCGRRQPLPRVCPDCKSEHLARLGYGTQRVEQELGELLKDGKTLRMDTDTTATRHAYEELLGAFRRREADVLLGTQMVTKGHDFPGVTLVGVLMADTSLYLDDYRAAERTFSMLTQVVGRAGRAGKAGRAIIQTCNPDHDVIRLACKQDYEAFYEREIRLRQLLVFPPFCDMALLTLSHKNEQTLFTGAKLLTDQLKEAIAGEYRDVKLIAFGPFEAPIYRAEGRYRMRLVIKCRLQKRTRALFRAILTQFQQNGTGLPQLSIDFNPTNL